MKKTIISLSIFLLLAVPGLVFAQGQGSKQQNRVQDPATHTVTSTPQGNQVQNQNQVTTQNQGEDSNLEINNQEQENLGLGQGNGQGEGTQNRNQNAVQNMSEVAKYVQQLLQMGESGGIGEEVSQIAQEQNQAQIRIQEQLNKLNSKGQLVRMITGTDYKAVNNLKAQLEQNRVRIQQLENLQNQLVNQGDIQMVQETIQALIAQNTSLQERIASEEQTKSMFGWLFRFFAK